VAGLIAGVLLLVSGTSARAADDEIPSLKPPHGELKPSYWETHPWAMLTSGVVGVGIVFAVVQLIRRPLPGPSPSPTGMARQKLTALRERNEDAAVAAEVSNVLRQYLAASFGMPSVALTTTELSKSLVRDLHIHAELAQTVERFLRQCDQWKFGLIAPLPGGTLANHAIDLIRQLEESGRHTDAPPPLPQATCSSAPAT